jgi:tetratricopeptide (TPR) repeat protein
MPAPPVGETDRDPFLRPGPWALVALGLSALVFLAFGPALNAGFVNWDDPALITDNPHFRGLSPEHLRWMFSTPLLGHYQPLTWVSYALDYLAWGMNPRGYHLTNIVIHAANAVLVFALVRRLMRCAGAWRGGVGIDGSLWPALIAAALWAVHPLRVESVAWVTERRDVLSTLFLLGAMLAYLRGVEPRRIEVRSRAWHALAAGLLLLSLLSKAWGMTFFVLALIADWYPLCRLPPGPAAWFGRTGLRLLVQKLPFIALGVAAAVGAGLSQHTALATKSLEQWGPLERAVQACYGVFFYLQRTLVPADLSPLHELPRNLDPAEPRFLISYLFVLALGVLTFAWWRSRPAFVAALGVYAVMLGPVLGVLQSGEQFVADRYSYLALIGWTAALAGAWSAWAGTRAEGDAWRRAVLAAGAAAVLACVVLSRAQTRVWNDSLSLWTHAAAVEERTGPRGGLVLAYLGAELEARGQIEQAVLAHARAVEVDPALGRSWFSLGNIMRHAGRPADAEAALIQATRTLPQAFMAHVNLGNLYLNELNRPEAAVEQFRLAVADVERGGRRPLSALPYLSLGVGLRRTGDLAGARAAFERAADFEETRDAARRELDALGPPGP